LTRRFVLFVLLTLLSSFSLQAQILNYEVGADSVRNTIVPVISYGSDKGLIGGIIYDRTNYKGDTEPYRNRLKGKVMGSTLGFVEVEATYEQPRTWNSPVRSVVDLHFHRYKADNYFGIGNNTPFKKKRYEKGFYDYKSVGWELSIDGYYPVYKGKNNRQLDLQFGVGMEYENPVARGDSTSFALYPPKGNKGGWSNYISAGLIFENRDRTYDPRHGNLTSIRLSYSPGFVGNFSLISTHGQFRQYFQPFSFLTIANMLNLRYVGGDIPFWKMSTLGDDNTLRGYPLNRFQGNASVAYSLELRSWLLKFPQFYKLRIGGHLFTDIGRVFTRDDEFKDTFRAYHQTFGIGGTLSILESDFILRGELGFSEDTTRIYIGLGYLF